MKLADVIKRFLKKQSGKASYLESNGKILSSKGYHIAFWRDNILVIYKDIYNSLARKHAELLRNKAKEFLLVNKDIPAYLLELTSNPIYYDLINYLYNPYSLEQTHFNRAFYEDYHYLKNLPLETFGLKDGYYGKRVIREILSGLVLIRYAEKYNLPLDFRKKPALWYAYYKRAIRFGEDNVGHYVENEMNVSMYSFEPLEHLKYVFKPE
jgi:hypothetical protein